MVWYGMLCIDGSSTGFCALLPCKLLILIFCVLPLESLHTGSSQCLQPRQTNQGGGKHQEIRLP